MSNQLLTLMFTQAWQIALLAIVVAIVTRTIARNRPHLAHAMWILVLIKCVTPPIWGHSLGVFSQLQTRWASDEQLTNPASTLREPDPADAHLSEAVERAPDAREQSLDSADTWEGAEADEETSVAIFPAGDPPKELLAVDESAASATAEAPRPGFYSWPATVLFCLVVGACVTLSLMIARCVNCLRSIYRHRTTEFDEPLRQRLQDLAKKLRIRRVPRIIVSDVLFGPAVLGLWRYTIVLPRCLLQTSRSFLPERIFAEGEPARSESKNAGLPVDTACTQVAASREVLPGRQDQPKPLPGRQDLQFLDPILAHELLHIRRGDLRTGTLQALVQSLWWFHPAVWLCNRWLSREAERCCDEQVIAELGCSPAQYARSLLSVIESKHQLQPVPVFPGMKPVEITSQRMERIMSLKTGLQKQTPLWCWLAVAALAIVVLPGAIAKPQSDEKVIEAQPEEMDLPQEARVAVVPKVEVSTKTYLVGDLVERLAKEQSLSLDQARKNLLQIFEASVVPVHRHVQGVPAPPVNLPQPSPPADSSPNVIPLARPASFSSTEIVVLSSCTIEGDRVVFVQSAAGHATLQQYIDAVRQYGFTTFQVTARYIMGPPEEINSLMESLQQEKPFPKAAEGETVAKSSQSEKQAPQSAATFCVGTTGIVSMEEARKIEELARSKADCLSIQCPKVSAINGQVATIQVGETKPFILGFKENDEPMIRTVVEGLTLRVTPKVLDKGLFQIKSVACLEGTSEQHMIIATGRVTETPKMFSLPAITTKKVQTTVELQESQALLQSGMITTEDGKSRAFLAVLEVQLIAPEVAAKGVEKEGKGEIRTAGNPSQPVADLKGNIRLHEDFGWSPAIHPRTIVAYVNDKSITVLDIVPAAHQLFQFSISQTNDRGHKKLPLESAIRKCAPEYLYDELLLQHFQEFATEEQKSSLKKQCEEQFIRWKVQEKRTEKRDTDDDLDAWLRTSGDGLTLGDLEKIFARTHTVQGYIEMLPKDSPLLEKQKILQHCRMLFDVAALHLTVVEYPIPELVKTDDSSQVVGHGHTSRRSIFLKELESMLNSLERDSWQTYGGLGTITIDDKNETVSICQTKSVHVKVAALLAELDAEVTKRKKRLELRTYSVADLITRPTSSAASSSVLINDGTVRSAPDSIPSEAADTDPNTLEPKLDFAPLVELIKASIEPESWDAGIGAVGENGESISLVIRQTPAGHEAIARLLSQLRKSYDSVKVTCRLLKIATDAQLKGLEDKCSLHSLSDDQRWALLTKTRSEALQKFLADEKVETLSCPTIMTISGQAALVQVATTDGAALTGFQLSANPHLIADSSVIRLSHSVTVGELAKDAQAAVHESLVGSGQTLLLVIEQPGKVDGQPDRFVVMLTPEHLKEEEETLPR